MSAMTAPILVAFGVLVIAASLPRRPARSVEPVSWLQQGSDPWRNRVLRRVLVDRWTGRRVRREPGAAAVAAWCDDLARELRSGTTLRQALTNVVPDDASTSACTAPLRLGLQRARPIEQALTGDVGAHLQLAVAVIVAAAEVGGSAAPAIDRVAATLRQRAADRDERRVQAAQARLSAHVMTAVPVVMLALLVVSDGDVRTTLATPVGGACVVVGLTLNVVGWLWMRRIVGAGS